MRDYSDRIKLISLIRRDERMNMDLARQNEVGGKAQGLLTVHEIVNRIDESRFPNVKIDIPEMVVLGTSVFDAFMDRNQLLKIALSSTQNDRIAHAFQKAELPFEVLGDLRNLLEKWSTPLAIRSSGLLEDTMHYPFAGVYLTKMTPNNAPNIETRFQKLIEAIKFVWASTYFNLAKDYALAVGVNIQHEKMAVIIQKMVGSQYQNRYYPELSGVARSYNFYPYKPAKPEDGVACLALGLGKTVVDGNKTWTYSPQFPESPPPFKTVDAILQETQNEFWVVNMGNIQEYNPIKETEYMQKENLLTAEKDGVLNHLASTFDLEAEKLSIGIGFKGPRVLTFAPLLTLRLIPLNDVIRELLEAFASFFSHPVEIEFAMTFNPHCFNLLQVRPMKLYGEKLQMDEKDLTDSHVIAASKTVLGNGILENIQDIVYVKPDQFDLRFSKEIASELEKHNQKLIQEECPYLLIVFGRLGTLDPWLGIPISWGKICGAKVIVEATLENNSIELSQGSHYFHNIINLDVKYFSMPFTQPYLLDWKWIESQKVIVENRFTKHIRCNKPIIVKVDGKRGWGVVSRNDK